MSSAQAPQADAPWTPLALASLPTLPPLRLAVVGHVEVVSFVQVEALPKAGEILRARHFHELPAGGGAVVAVQMARLLGTPVPFFTALGRDAIGERAAAQLQDLGLELHVSWQEAPTRRAITFVDGEGERTITVIVRSPLASTKLMPRRVGASRQATCSSNPRASSRCAASCPKRSRPRAVKKGTR